MDMALERTNDFYKQGFFQIFLEYRGKEALGTIMQTERVVAAAYEKLEIAQLLAGSYSCLKLKDWTSTPGNIVTILSIPDFFN